MDFIQNISVDQFSVATGFLYSYFKQVVIPYNCNIFFIDHHNWIYYFVFILTSCYFFHIFPDAAAVGKDYQIIGEHFYRSR